VIRWPREIFERGRAAAPLTLKREEETGQAA
jgi:hypothetical protein